MEIDLKQVKELLDAFEERNMQKFQIKKGDFEITLERQVEAVEATSQVSAVNLSHALASHAIAPQPIHAHPSGDISVPSSEAVAGNFIDSPMVGTFYSSPSPEDPAFVKVGDKVQEGEVVCIIEAMKVMNEVKATSSGVVQEILIENGQPVEFGTKMFRIT